MMEFDHYVYPGTNILKNKQGVMDAQAAYDSERLFSLKRVSEFRSSGVTGRFDSEHLKAIHKFLFQDVYDWAGEFRDIEIFKGTSGFETPDRISSELDGLFSDIRNKNYFRGLSKQDAANGMADAMCRLNAIHPFREGNGRTQRAFMEQLALNAGYELDFSHVTENDMRDASFAASVRDDTRLMRYLFRSNMTETGVLGPVEVINTQESVHVTGVSVSGTDEPACVLAARFVLDKLRGMFRKPVDVRVRERDTSDLDKAYGDVMLSDTEAGHDDCSL